MTYSDDAPLVTGMAIIQKNNQLEVYTADRTRSVETALFNAVDKPDAIAVKQSDGVVHLEAANPGSRVKLTSSGSPSGSVGYLAYKMENGQRKTGFVTAGHVVKSGMKVYDANGAELGNCLISMGPAPGNVSIDGTGDVDAAFVQASAVSSTVSGTGYTQDMNAILIPAEGGQLYKSQGALGVKQGTVYSLYFDASWLYMEGPFVRRILATYDSTSGDSGAMVYNVSASTNWKARAIGVHQGDVAVNGVRYACVISASNIQTAMGVYVGN